MDDTLTHNLRSLDQQKMFDEAFAIVTFQTQKREINIGDVLSCFAAETKPRRKFVLGWASLSWLNDKTKCPDLPAEMICNIKQKVIEDMVMDDEEALAVPLEFEENIE